MQKFNKQDQQQCSNRFAPPSSPSSVRSNLRCDLFLTKYSQVAQTAQHVKTEVPLSKVPGFRENLIVQRVVPAVPPYDASSSRCFSHLERTSWNLVAKWAVILVELAGNGHTV